MKRHLAKAPVNHWAHQDDANNVKSQQVIQIIDFQNYIVRVLYPGESLTVTLDKVSYGDYVYLNMRICKLPAEKGGLEATHKLQRQATIAANAARPYSSPDFVLDSALMERIRMALIRDVETGKYTDTTRVMGTPQDTDPQGHLYGWGGLAVDDAANQPINKNLTKVEEGKALPSQHHLQSAGNQLLRRRFLVDHDLQPRGLARQRPSRHIQRPSRAQRRRDVHDPLQQPRPEEQREDCGAVFGFASGLCAQVQAGNYRIPREDERPLGHLVKRPGTAHSSDGLRPITRSIFAPISRTAALRVEPD